MFRSLESATLFQLPESAHMPNVVVCITVCSSLRSRLTQVSKYDRGKTAGIKLCF